ncbi:DUF5681 domain-containing protein [Ferrovibrio sp.]|jgi:hypothetical protein|uniref:DUF5681 domain-containing protein n=1 Tax=Ferrovibrio sp. TaxID=1917215 RepID=UPI0035123384
MSKASDGKSYEVGYGVPPQKTKFKPGQSGNKKGRPKKTPLSINESAYVAVASELVTIKLNGKKTTVTAEQAVWLKIRQAALSGDAKAWKIWLQARQTAVKHEVIRPVKSGGLLPDSNFVWTEEIKKSLDEVFAWAEKKEGEAAASTDASDTAPAAAPLESGTDGTPATDTGDDAISALKANHSSADE